MMCRSPLGGLSHCVPIRKCVYNIIYMPLRLYFGCLLEKASLLFEGNHLHENHILLGTSVLSYCKNICIYK